MAAQALRAREVGSLVPGSQRRVGGVVALRAQRGHRFDQRRRDRAAVRIVAGDAVAALHRRVHAVALLADPAVAGGGTGATALLEEVVLLGALGVVARGG